MGIVHTEVNQIDGLVCYSLSHYFGHLNIGVKDDCVLSWEK